VPLFLGGFGAITVLYGVERGVFSEPFHHVGCHCFSVGLGQSRYFMDLKGVSLVGPFSLSSMPLFLSGPLCFTGCPCFSLVCVG
jgi:hypothetical protein